MYTLTNLLSFLLFFMPGCIHDRGKITQENSDRYDTFAQIAIPEHPGIMQIRNAVAPKIDAIIQQELNVPDGVNFPRFHIPSWQRKASRLTLYYLNNLKKGAEGFLADALDTMQKEGKGITIAKTVAIISPLHFFGDKQQYIVFSIHDPQKSLEALHTEIGIYARNAQKGYHKTHHDDLYNIEKSERFAYTPHIALGRLQPEYFAPYVEGLPQEEQFKGGTIQERETVTKRIQERIATEVFPVIEQLLKTVPTLLDINSFCLYEYSENKRTWRECHKEYPLKQEVLIP